MNNVAICRRVLGFCGLLLFLAQGSVGAEPDRAREWAELKRAFPPHSAGPVTDASDPLIIECYRKYEAAVNELTPATLAKGVGKLRETLESDIRRYERLNRDNGRSDSSGRNKVMTPSMRHAIEKNLVWLKSRLRPYVARLESHQRQRPQ